MESNNLNQQEKNFSLSRDIAMTAMCNGKKVQHKTFFDWEYLKQSESDIDLIENEEGFTYSKATYFDIYPSEVYDFGWRLFE